jgi:hypothetical protein
VAGLDLVRAAPSGAQAAQKAMPAPSMALDTAQTDMERAVTQTAVLFTELYACCVDCKDRAPLPFAPWEGDGEYRDYEPNQVWLKRHDGHNLDYTEKLSARRPDVKNDHRH